MSTSGHPPQDGPGGAGEVSPATGSPRAVVGASGGDPSWRPDEALVRRVRQEIAAAAAAATSRAAGADGPPEGARPAGRAVVLPVGAARRRTLRRRTGHGRSALVALAVTAALTVVRAVATGSRFGGRDGEGHRPGPPAGDGDRGAGARPGSPDSEET